MKIISIINLKGGVAKTISSINIAHILAIVHSKKVLIIDNDKQGNTSKFFSLGNEEELSIADILLNRDINIKDVIGATQYENIDLIKANMSLLQANLTIKQSDILKRALEDVNKDYYYCIIDNAPDINLSTINAIVASNDILIPVKADVFALDGLKEINEQINNAKQVNPNLILKGCFITQWQNNNIINKRKISNL
jgi:chromosome partitioning protein